MQKKTLTSSFVPSTIHLCFGRVSQTVQGICIHRFADVCGAIFHAVPADENGSNANTINASGIPSASATGCGALTSHNVPE